MNATAPSTTQPADHAHESAAVRTAPLALWRVAQAFLGVLHILFGAPETVAARHTLTGKAHAHMASWLRSAEAMLRRLLLIEASAIAKPNARALLKPRRTRQPKLMHFTPDHPEAWRVSFRVFSSPVYGGSVSAQRAMTMGAAAPSVAYGDTSPVNGGGKGKRLSREERWCAEHRPPQTFRSAWPLAERYEALLRVFNDPGPYARRLSKRLHATPHRLGEALRAPPEATHRVDRFDEFRDCAEQSWRPLFSSA